MHWRRWTPRRCESVNSPPLSSESVAASLGCSSLNFFSTSWKQHKENITFCNCGPKSHFHCSAMSSKRQHVSMRAVHRVAVIYDMSIPWVLGWFALATRWRYDYHSKWSCGYLQGQHVLTYQNDGADDRMYNRVTATFSWRKLFFAVAPPAHSLIFLKSFKVFSLQRSQD